MDIGINSYLILLCRMLLSKNVDAFSVAKSHSAVVVVTMFLSFQANYVQLLPRFSFFWKARNLLELAPRALHFTSELTS